MSSSPQERDRNYFTSPDFNQLDDILDNLIGQACVTPSPSTPPPPTPPPTCANAKLDLVFAVDGSGSICDNDLRSKMAGAITGIILWTSSKTLLIS